MQTITTKCVDCGREFTYSVNDAKNHGKTRSRCDDCNKKHNYAYHQKQEAAKRERNRELRETTCIICGKKFIRLRVNSPGRRCPECVAAGRTVQRPCLAERARNAREAGMSYGQYIARRMQA